MLRRSLAGLDRRRLRLGLMAFFLALAAPAGVLIHHAYGQLKWEAFHQHRVLAEELAARIDGRLARAISREEARSFSDYAFLIVKGDTVANLPERSPLAAFPVDAGVAGLVGYFQVDPDGTFSTPLLPREDTGGAPLELAPKERAERAALQSQIARVLTDNRLVQARERPREAEAPRNEIDRSDRDLAAEEAPDSTAAALNDDKLEQEAPPSPLRGQAAFDELSAPAKAQAARPRPSNDAPGRNLGRVSDLELDSEYSSKLESAMPTENQLRKRAPPTRRASRKELSAAPPPAAVTSAAAPDGGARQSGVVDLRTFESEIDPFEIGQLDSGHLVLFRRVFREGQRYIQGALIDEQAFIAGTIEEAFDETSLSRMSNLAVAFGGNLVAAFRERSSVGGSAGTGTLTGALLYQTRLSAPFEELELILSVTRLPAGPGAKVVAWVAGILAAVLCGGFYLMYRMGARQIDLTAQQQDFVSAVSHELKTPLTSIRMYGEMLRDGWAPEEKKSTYYEYIFQESERLSRLIANVLQLARMTRNELEVDLKPVTVAELTDGIRSKVSSQVERAGFELVVECPQDIGMAALCVDADCFSQIAINLVDNALKFSAKAQRKLIEIRWSARGPRTVQLSIRDHGPGVREDQMRKIFHLFFRSENELTRETVGTGIGLALVRQLAQAMGAGVDVVNRDPGAEFQILFPRADGTLG